LKYEKYKAANRLNRKHEFNIPTHNFKEIKLTK